MNIRTCRALCPFVILGIATSAHASMEKATVMVENIDYSNGYGQRNVASVEAVGKFMEGDTTLVINAATGKREYGDDVSFSGSRLTGTVYHNWNRSFFTRTSISASTNDPVFANREIAHDFNVKPFRSTVVTAGAKYSEYYGGVYATSLSAGGSYYWPRVTISYRYTRFDISNGGDSYGNVLSFRLKDPRGGGSTQLWLGKGTSIYAYDWLSDLEDGKMKNVTLRRVQPLIGGLTLSASVGKAWHETPFVRYEGVTANLGLSFAW